MMNAIQKPNKRIIIPTAVALSVAVCVCRLISAHNLVKKKRGVLSD